MIKFIEAPSTEDMVCRRISEDGQIEIGVWPVLFGFRIRAGFVGAWGPEVDWCCGKCSTTLNAAYNLCLTLLENNVPFNQIIPHSTIKPIFNDPEFNAWMTDIITKLSDSAYPKIKLPPLEMIRREFEENFLDNDVRITGNLIRTMVVGGKKKPTNVG